jgi:hypothetical protein
LDQTLAGLIAQLGCATSAQFPVLTEQLLRACRSISRHLPCFRLGMRFALKPLANLWRRSLQWFFRN